MTSNYAPFFHNVDAPDHGRAFRVTDAGGLNISVAAGRARIDQTVFEFGAATPLVLLGASTYRIYIDNAGNITAAVVGAYPANSIPLAIVVTGAATITSITDNRCFFYEDTAAGGGGGYDTIEDEGGALPQRTVIDFVGLGVTAADVGGETRVTIPGGGAPHNLLDGVTHPDTVAQAVSAGSLVFGDDTPDWNELVRAVPAANVRNVLGLDFGDTVPAWKAALDAVNPADVAGFLGAAPGTSLIFSHRDHVHAHPNIAQDIHNIYAYLPGRLGGQTLRGDTAAAGNLVLQSTANAARGFVQFPDDLQFTATPKAIFDNLGLRRIQVQSVNPFEIIFTGAGATDACRMADTGFFGGPVPVGYGRLSFGSPAITGAVIGMGGALTRTANFYGFGATPAVRATGTFLEVIGLKGDAACRVDLGQTVTDVGGMLFSATKIAGHAGTITRMYGAKTFLQSLDATAVAEGMGLWAASPFFSVGGITTIYGVRADNQGNAAVTDAVNIFADTCSGAANNYIMWLGAAFPGGTPLLRLDPGAPGVGNTGLFLAEGVGPALRQVQFMDPGVGGVNFAGGERVMILV